MEQTFNPSLWVLERIASLQQTHYHKRMKWAWKWRLNAPQCHQHASSAAAHLCDAISYHSQRTQTHRLCVTETNRTRNGIVNAKTIFLILRKWSCCRKMNGKMKKEKRREKTWKANGKIWRRKLKEKTVDKTFTFAIRIHLLTAALYWLRIK